MAEPDTAALVETAIDGYGFERTDAVRALAQRLADAERASDGYARLLADALARATRAEEALRDCEEDRKNLLLFLGDTRDAAARRDDPEMARIIGNVLAKFAALTPTEEPRSYTFDTKAGDGHTSALGIKSRPTPTEEPEHG